MESIEEAILTLLTTTTALTAFTNRVFYARVPQGTKLPYVVFYSIDPDNTAVDFCVKDGGQPTFSVDFTDELDSSNSNCRDYGLTMIKELNRFRGTVGNIEIFYSKMTGPTVLPDPQKDNQNIGSVQWEVQHDQQF
jgi:hypothetical protein